MRILNYALAALIIAGVLIFLYRFLQSSDVDRRSDTGMLTIDKLSVSQLVEITAKTLNSFLRQDFTSQNLTRQELENKNAAKARLRQALKDAAYGDREARAVIMEYIKSVITTNGALRVTENNIDEFIPFDDLEHLSSQDKFLMILQGYSRIYGVKALNRMFADLGFDKTNQVDAQMVDDACDILSDAARCAEAGLPARILDYEFEDKLDYVTHRIFESYKGFGVADSLVEMEVDEIDAGVSGLPTGSFDLTNDFVKSAKYAYESIWISLHGRNIHLSCLSFGSEDELERVCHNIYKYHATRVFSREQGYVVSSMKNGSRVVVTRPPFSDKYAFYVRKFDSSPSIEPENLIVGTGCEIPLILCKWFVKGQRNIAITGQQNTGKTTLLKSMIRWIDDLNIRTQELAFELNLSFSFPDKNISSFQETDSISAQEGLNLQKKTNGAVNIVGEVANAEQASHIIQTANIASLFAMFTYHAKTAQALVEMFALHLLQLGLYKEKRDAVEISAKTLNIDIHLENTKGYRHIDKISEIIPVETEEYPSELMQRAYLEKTGQQMEYTQEMALLDQREFYRRQTDRHLFDVNEICRWRNGVFELVHMPSEALITEIQSKLTDKNDEQAFLADMEHLRMLMESGREAEPAVLITQEG